MVKKLKFGIKLEYFKPICSKKLVWSNNINFRKRVMQWDLLGSKTIKIAYYVKNETLIVLVDLKWMLAVRLHYTIM